MPDEDLDFEDDLIRSHTATQGRILVRVRRVHIRKLRKPETVDYQESGSRLAEAPKNLVKENFISHTMKLVAHSLITRCFLTICLQTHY